MAQDAPTALAAGDPCEVAHDAIEIEKKVFLTEEQRHMLWSSLPAHAAKIFCDIYYDGPGFPLTTRDWWLRQRDGAWELKIPWSTGHGETSTHSYEEVVEDDAILFRLAAEGLLDIVDRSDAPAVAAAAAALAGAAAACQDATSLPHARPVLAHALEAGCITPFARLHTERVRLRAEDADLAAFGVRSLHVDMDTVTYDAAFAEPEALRVAGDCKPFVIAEVEIMAPKEQGAIDAASEALDAFLRGQGLQDAPEAYSKIIEYLLRFRPAHLEALVVVGLVSRERLARLRAVAGGPA